jgi:hypothetical protein
MWMWPFPFAPDIEGNGLFFPRIPNAASAQLQQSERSYTREDFEITIEEYIERAR